MASINPKNHRLRVARLISLSAIGFTLVISALTAAAPREVSSKSAPDRDHHLFVGLDLFVNHESEFVAVRKISDKDALIDTPAHDRVRLGKSPRFRIKMATKVSANSASIAKLKAVATYSAGNDPAMIAMLDQARIQNAMADQVDAAEQRLSTADVRASAVEDAIGDNPEGSRGVAYEDTPEGIMEIASSDFEDALSIQESMNDALDFGSDEDEDQNYDAIRVSFEVSSEFPMADAYAVILIRVEHNHELSDFTTYERIGKVDQKPRRVKIYHEGFRPGYKIKETRVFVYNYGEEIVTNLSDKHYKLTSSEAREFVKLDHQGRNRRDTVPAEPSWELAPPILQATETSQDYDYPVTVELDAAGNLVSIITTGQIIPEHVQAVLRETTFVPALEKGDPVASTLVVNPADFFKD